MNLKSVCNSSAHGNADCLLGGGDYLLSDSFITHFGTLGNYGRKNGGISLPVKKTLWNG